MAPNLRKASLPTTESLTNVSTLFVLKPILSVAPQREEASYWDWPAVDEKACAVPVDLFSAIHLEANLIQVAPTVSALVAEHDDYWAEASSSSSSPAPREHAPMHADYWAEAPHEISSTDAYWAQAHPSKHYGANESHADYWNEASYNRTASDAYWLHDDRDEAAYWHEASHASRATDRYWSMAVL